MNLRKIWLNINGTERIIVCDPKKDTLADVIRRIGLTGTKVGCKAGQCGICSVLLNGKIVRSCVKKIKDVPEYSNIITIEGIGTPTQMHPLQLAWVAYGGVQCGFCTPGFIVSAKALLDVNLSPTREEVRDWFQKNRNVCRCTGYKPLVDAVMAAAEVMRGEKSREELLFKIPDDGCVYGTKLPKPTALAKVTGTCDFGDDIGMKMPEGTLHLAIVQPEISHADIIEIDCSEAEKMPGVVKVITAKDIRGTNRVALPITHPRSKTSGMMRRIINDTKVYRRGDVLAVVAARSREEARDAAKKVRLNLEPLPEYMNYLDAVSPDAVRIYEECDNNFMCVPVFKGEDTRSIFDTAPYVVEGSFHTTRQPHLSLEPETMQAYWDEEGRMTIQCKCQSVHSVRKVVAGGIGLTEDKIRIIENPTGASFGAAMTPSAPALIAACAMAVDHPVTLTMSWSEYQHYIGKRAASYSNGRLACDRDGKILALEFELGFDHGAYPETANAVLPKSLRFVGFPYDIPNLMGLARGALTNHNFATAYRSFGSPQGYMVSESLMDMMARKIGMDPFKLRCINVAREGALTNNGYPYREYPMEKLMDLIKPYYNEAVKRAKDGDTPGKRRGVGFVCGGYHVSMSVDKAEVTLELNPDGTVTHYNCWEDQGQGADVGTLVLTHETLRPLGLTPDQIRLVQNDTAFCPATGPASGSRSHYMAGNATMDAAEKLLNAMRKEDGTYRSWQEMIDEGIPTRYDGIYSTVGLYSALDPNTGKGDPYAEAMYICYVAEVEVDTATGKVTVLKMTGVSDVGVVGNILAVEGQAYGSLSHAIGFALQEDYDDLKKHATLGGAGIPFCKDTPDDMKIIFHEAPRSKGPKGSSGCSESFQGCAHVAVLNAIYDATGVRIYDLPASPSKIKEAMDAKAQGNDVVPEKYFLGEDFYTTMDDIRENPIKVHSESVEAVLREGH